jgi:hypothetical protein
VILTRWGERPRRVLLYRAALRARDPKPRPWAAGGVRACVTGLSRAAGRSVVRGGCEVKRLTPTIIEVIVRAPMQARKFCPGQFYSRTEPGGPGAYRRGHGAGLGGPGLDRRLGGQGTRAHLAHRARDGQLIAPVCALETGRSAGLHGRHRGPDRHPLGQDRDAVRRRSGQRRAVLDRKGVARRGQSSDLLRQLSQPPRRLQGGRDRGGPRTSSCGRWIRSRVLRPSR